MVGDGYLKRFVKQNFKKESEIAFAMRVKEYTIDDLIDVVKRYNDNDKDFKLIRKAFDLAEKAHGNQKRMSGEPFIQHCLSVAIILAERKMDHETICAALLHDTVEDAGFSVDTIRKEFDEETAGIVQGVTKIEKVRFTSKEDYTAENLRKVLLATSKDARVMILKLADRLDNMRTLGSFNEDKQKRIAQETLDIYAPIAHKLGMWKIKGELEDLSLRYLQPESYNELKKMINEKRDEREQKTQEIVADLEQKLERLNIDAKVKGRAKYFYSIYKKMLEKGKSFDDINDLIAIRIVTKTVPECYTALELVKRIFKPLDDRFKDYIKNPKKNGYQSIHVDVKTPDNKILEIQIRTIDMHHQAEEGVAAHWQYKQTDRDKRFDRKISWLKQILDWKVESKGKEFLEDLKIDLFQDEIVVLTPKSDPIILPEDATPVDFAYMVHTNVGDTCSKAEVNGKIVPLDYKMRSGDICKIITQKNATPNRSWLNFVKTSKAKQKIRAALSIAGDKDVKAARMAQEMESIESNLVKYLDHDGKRNVKLSKCCNPQFNDEISAFLTKDGTVTIHKKTCPNIAILDKTKEVPMKWKSEDKTVKTIMISVKDRIGMIRDILNVAMETQNPTLSINIKTIKENLLMTLKIKVINDDNLKKFIEQVSKIQDVHSVKIHKRFFPLLDMY